MSGVMPPSTALLKRSKALSPAVQRTLLALLGTVIATAPYFVPVLAPFAAPLTALGAALGGGAVIRRPGDARVKP
jgi:hypothetical protein